MTCCTRNCQKWTLLSFSTVFLIVGIAFISTWNIIYQALKRMELNLASENTIEFKMWKKTPIPMYIEFYLFNWTNVDEVIESDWKKNPHFEELGPYTYSEVHIRENITFNDNNTITYKTRRVWQFEEKMSGGSLDDLITTVNVIVATIGKFVQRKHVIVRMGVDFFLREKQVNLTVTKTAREFLFDGYDDPMLDLMHKLHMKGIDVPFDKFAWFYGRNESIDYDGAFNMYDGSTGLDQLGRIIAWNYAPTTGLYPGECGKVQGTSGELWYPVGDAKEVDVFASDTCSTVTLDRSGKMEMFGIEGNRYIGTEKVFDNGTKYPEMGCFSVGESLPSGVRNVSECKFGAPAFVSYPHFYLADPFYTEAVDNMHPNDTRHQFFIGIEPETGIPMQVQASFQINIYLQPVANIKLLENIKAVMIPAMWFRQTAEIDKNLASQAKMLLLLPNILQYTSYGLIGLGCLLLLVGAYVTFKLGWNWEGRRDEMLIDQDN